MTEATRRRLPDSRYSITRKVSIGKLDYYLNVGFFSDGSPGEVFIKISKAGTLLSGMTNALCKMISIGLQYGVPVETIVDKLIGMRFEPCNDDVLSICDSIAKQLADILINGDENGYD